MSIANDGSSPIQSRGIRGGKIQETVGGQQMTSPMLMDASRRDTYFLWSTVFPPPFAWGGGRMCSPRPYREFPPTLQLQITASGPSGLRKGTSEKSSILILAPICPDTPQCLESTKRAPISINHLPRNVVSQSRCSAPSDG